MWIGSDTFMIATVAVPCRLWCFLVGLVTVSISWRLTPLSTKVPTLFTPSKLIIKDNNLVNLVHRCSSSYLANKLRAQFTSLAVGYDTAGNRNAHCPISWLISTWDTFHHPTKPVLFMRRDMLWSIFSPLGLDPTSIDSTILLPCRVLILTRGRLGPWTNASSSINAFAFQLTSFLFTFTACSKILHDLDCPLSIYSIALRRRLD
jgi:hypothetical protein